MRLHSSPATAPIGAALARLTDELTTYPALAFAPVLIQGEDGRPLADVDTLVGSRACFRARYGAMRSA